jgi:hypothetical protein
MVVPHRGHLTVLLCRLDIWDVVRACIAGWSGGLFRELLEGAGGEGREEVRHRMPGTANQGAVEVISACTAGGELVLVGHENK